jgi:hypothetical protein
MIEEQLDEVQKLVNLINERTFRIEKNLKTIAGALLDLKAIGDFSSKQEEELKAIL